MHLFYHLIFNDRAYPFTQESVHCKRVYDFRYPIRFFWLTEKGLCVQGDHNPDPRKCRIRITNRRIITVPDLIFACSRGSLKNMERFEWFVKKRRSGDNEFTRICERSERKHCKTNAPNA
jgi:hypothetical protein